jgi:hypothetical protein
MIRFRRPFELQCRLVSWNYFLNFLTNSPTFSGSGTRDWMPHFAARWSFCRSQRSRHGSPSAIEVVDRHWLGRQEIQARQEISYFSC